VLCFACVAFALAGVDLMHFVVALFTLGVGWNFLYIGGTTLLTQAYRPEEKTAAQGALDFCVYASMTLTSVGAGALVTNIGGWQWLNVGALLPLVVIALALGWLTILRVRAPRAGASVG